MGLTYRDGAGRLRCTGSNGPPASVIDPPLDEVRDGQRVAGPGLGWCGECGHAVPIAASGKLFGHGPRGGWQS